jgi:hypothetical protein
MKEPSILYNNKVKKSASWTEQKEDMYLRVCIEKIFYNEEFDPGSG